jgi:hypothetical protein
MNIDRYELAPSAVDVMCAVIRDPSIFEPYLAFQAFGVISAGTYGNEVADLIEGEH